ncbi:MAG: transcription termination/antitermination NusG family protein [Pseudomonadota bacterium]
MEKVWYALAVQPRKESFVERQLQSAGINAACPRYRKTIRHARSVKCILSPFFPGYLFVQLDPASQDWRQVNWVRGSIGLIKFDNRPARLSSEFVSSFISSLDSNGLVQLEPDLQIGARVQAIGGPFDRLSGEVIDLPESDRVKILMDALNRKVETTLPRSSLVVAA